MRKISVIALCMSFILTMAACGNQEAERYEKHIVAMDTIISVTVYDADGEGILEECKEIILHFDRLFSSTNVESDISRINAGAGSFVDVSEETMELIRTAIAFTEETDGAFDITVAPLIELWGFTSGNYHVPTQAEINACLARKGKIELRENAVRIDEGMALDVGGIAKGYVSDYLVEYLRNRGVQSAIVSLGGNVQTLGERTNGERWAVGLMDPKDNDNRIGVIFVDEKAVVTSGDYFRYFEQDGQRYHHILDPATGYPAQNGVKSVTVVCDDGAMADSLSTALFVMGPQKAVDYWRESGDFEMMMITDDQKIYVTKGLEEDYTAETTAYELNVIE